MLLHSPRALSGPMLAGRGRLRRRYQETSYYRGRAERLGGDGGGERRTAQAGWFERPRPRPPRWAMACKALWPRDPSRGGPTPPPLTGLAWRSRPWRGRGGAFDHHWIWLYSP
eukprot:3120945-Pyramimonas_sp.AAC.1